MCCQDFTLPISPMELEFDFKRFKRTSKIRFNEIDRIHSPCSSISASTIGLASEIALPLIITLAAISTANLDYVKSIQRGLLCVDIILMGRNANIEDANAVMRKKNKSKI